jgi:Fic family protein
MQRGPTGTYETKKFAGEAVRAFIPSPLPPQPDLQLDAALQARIELATVSLGRLDSIASLLPDPDLFIYSYVRKEALLSSQIEGTQSSLSELMLFEAAGAPGVPLDDVGEVVNYVAALEHGLQLLRSGELPLSNRLIRAIHGRLLATGRGSDKAPGEFRRSQNWLGGARPGTAAFVPSPPDRVPECMGDLERFLHADSHTALLRAALAHVQFETIHPFLDGNGRVGRLLITFLLCHARILNQPLLYLSLFFKQNRAEYYRLLDGVRQQGDWEAWVAFFLDGVAQTAQSAVTTARELVALFAADKLRVAGQGRKAASALRVHEAFRARPVQSTAALMERTGYTFPTAQKGIELLIALGIVREITGKKRNRVFVYGRYLDLLNEGTEAI